MPSLDALAALPDLRTLCRHGAVLPREPAALRDLDAVAGALERHGAGPPEEDAQQELEHALAASVEAACRAALARDGGPPAVALSGGLDSSAVAAIAGPLGARAFTLAVGRAGDEGPAAARALGLPHETIAPPPAGPLATPLADVVRALALPTHSAAPFAFLDLWRALASRGVRAVLTGDGADELLSGHAYHDAPGEAWAALDAASAARPAALLEAYRAVRGLEAEIDLDALLEPEARAALDARFPPWEESEAARALAACAARVRRPAERLRLLDVALRMRAQCVDLQARLCAEAGLAYAAPFAAPGVVRAAAAIPLGARRKGPLRALLERRAGAGGPWARLEKEPIHAPTGGRPREALPPPWLDALSPATVRRHRVFRPEAIAARMTQVRADRPFLPRALVVAATTHTWLDLNREG